MSVLVIFNPISSVLIVPFCNLFPTLVFNTFFNISGVIPFVYELINKNKGSSLNISILFESVVFTALSFFVFWWD